MSSAFKSELNNIKKKQQDASLKNLKNRARRASVNLELLRSKGFKTQSQGNLTSHGQSNNQNLNINSFTTSIKNFQINHLGSATKILSSPKNFGDVKTVSKEIKPQRSSKGLPSTPSGIIRENQKRDSLTLPQFDPKLMRRQSKMIQSFLKDNIDRNSISKDEEITDSLIKKNKRESVQSEDTKTKSLVIAKLSEKTLGNYKKQLSVNIKNNYFHDLSSEIVNLTSKNNESSSLLLINRDHRLLENKDGSAINSKRLSKENMALHTVQLRASYSKNDKHFERALDKALNDNTKEKDDRALRKIDKMSDSLLSNDEDIDVEQDGFLVIHPSSWFIKMLDIIILLLIAYIFIFEPYIIAFYIIEPTIFANISYMIDIIFMIEFIINFFIGYYDFEENLILNKKKIAINYLLSNFTIDFFTSIPFSIIFSNYATTNSSYTGSYQTSFVSFKILKMNKLTRLLKLFRLVRVLKLFKLLRKDHSPHSHHSGSVPFKVKFIEDLTINSTLKRFIKFFLYFLLFNHTSACIWIFIASLDHPNWISTANLTDVTNGDLYVCAIYFNFSTIFTIGYGDITSVSVVERGYNIVLMIFGVLLYSFAITSLSNIVSNIDAKEKKFHDNIEMLDEIKKKYAINDSLTHRLYKYLKYDLAVNRFDKKMILTELPTHLKNKLILNMYNSVLRNLKFFRKTSEEFKYKAVVMLKQLKVFRGEHLIKSGDYLEELYLIKKGILQLEIDTFYGKIKILQLSKNEHFGEVYMTLNMKSPVDVRVKSKCVEIFYLVKTDFITLNEEFPTTIRNIVKKSWLNSIRIEKKAMKIYQKIEEEYMNLNNLLQDGDRTDLNIQEGENGYKLININNDEDSSTTRFKKASPIRDLLNKNENVRNSYFNTPLPIIQEELEKRYTNQNSKIEYSHRQMGDKICPERITFNSNIKIKPIKSLKENNFNLIADSEPNISNYNNQSQENKELIDTYINTSNPRNSKQLSSAQKSKRNSSLKLETNSKGTTVDKFLKLPSSINMSSEMSSFNKRMSMSIQNASPKLKMDDNGLLRSRKRKKTEKRIFHLPLINFTGGRNDSSVKKTSKLINDTNLSLENNLTNAMNNSKLSKHSGNNSVGMANLQPTNHINQLNINVDSLKITPRGIEIKSIDDYYDSENRKSAERISKKEGSEIKIHKYPTLESKPKIQYNKNQFLKKNTGKSLISEDSENDMSISIKKNAQINISYNINIQNNVNLANDSTRLGDTMLCKSVVTKIDGDDKITENLTKEINIKDAGENSFQQKESGKSPLIENFKKEQVDKTRKRSITNIEVPQPVLQTQKSKQNFKSTSHLISPNYSKNRNRSQSQHLDYFSEGRANSPTLNKPKSKRNTGFQNYANHSRKISINDLFHNMKNDAHALKDPKSFFTNNLPSILDKTIGQQIEDQIEKLKNIFDILFTLKQNK